jgi:hypothetical protein
MKSISEKYKFICPYCKSNGTLVYVNHFNESWFKKIEIKLIKYRLWLVNIWYSKQDYFWFNNYRCYCKSCNGGFVIYSLVSMKDGTRLKEFLCKTNPPDNFVIFMKE